jgi:hypothetical protein
MELPRLNRLRLENDSTFKCDCAKNLRHLELDSFKNVGSLNDTPLDSVVIDSTKNFCESLSSLESLLTMDLCQANKVTTLMLECLYTPWNSDHAANLDAVLSKSATVSGTWDP